jgi:lysophospholipase L1-like esterase
MSKSHIALCIALLGCSSNESLSPVTGPAVSGAEPSDMPALTPTPPGTPPVTSDPGTGPSSEAQGPIGLSGGGPGSTSGEGSNAIPDAGRSPPGADAVLPEKPDVVPGEALTIFLAGDSTVSTYADTASPTDQAGWGQMIGQRFDERITIDNRAIGGRTARRFIDEGFLTELLADIQPGDYLFVQFGTNDGNRTATYTLGEQTIPYYLDPNTDFKAYLQQYIDGARRADANPILVTPPPRNSAYCTGGNGTGGHAQAMRELGAREGVPVLDLNAKSVAFLTAICPSPTPENFFLLRADGSVDGTHFQERGARFLAGFVVEAIAEAALPLGEYLRPGP